MRRTPSRGLTYIEVVVSLAILSTAMVAGLQTYGQFALGCRTWEERSKAAQLANRLMGEIMLLAYADPTTPNPLAAHTLGPEESANDSSVFNDVDDYHGWNASPPRGRDNVAITGYDGYRQRVSVEFDTSFKTATGLPISDYTVKKITVTIFKGDREMAKLVAIRAATDARM
jgi:type II secretory pathway pseudopilin PulG